MPESSLSSGTLQVEGWGVATLDLERRWTSYGDAIPDRVLLFRSPDSWSLLVVRLTDRDEAKGRVARASVSVRRFTSVQQLRSHIEEAYAPGSWHDLANAGQHERTLFVASLPERVSRDFDRASIIDKELALPVGPSGKSAPGPGRLRWDWRQHALDAMSARLVERGFRVVNAAAAEASLPASERDVGQVLLDGYGFEIPGVVRVDPAGEIYIRLPDDASFSDLEDCDQ